MRLSFSNGEHADVVIDNGVTGIGSAQGNAVMLDAGGVKPWHARLLIDQRGMVLEVLDAQARTHVNARPIVEKALLRLGDVINFDAVAAVIKPDLDEIIDTRVPAEAAQGGPSEVSRVVLRGVSGSHFGKTVSIGSRLLVGNGCSGLDLDEPGMAENHGA
ncbi:FHA domain-containing protein, partial [Dokdonella sp.]|uniref:FHA domain-containing protein n=1 Tax=Dokdonella sp. TaxID=2291710 RepID=UPI003C5E2274